MQLTSLQTLTLRNNKLETFPLEMLRVVPLVDLEGNPAYLEMFLNCELEDEEEEANKRSARRQALHRCRMLYVRVRVRVRVRVCVHDCVPIAEHVRQLIHLWWHVFVSRNTLIAVTVW